MKITKEQLTRAVDKGVLSAGSAEELWDFLSKTQPCQAKFDTSHVLFYMGGLLAMGAMTVLLGLGWKSFGGWGIFSISLVYAFIDLVLSAAR